MAERTNVFKVIELVWRCIGCSIKRDESLIPGEDDYDLTQDLDEKRTKGIKKKKNKIQKRRLRVGGKSDLFNFFN